MVDLPEDLVGQAEVSVDPTRAARLVAARGAQVVELAAGRSVDLTAVPPDPLAEVETSDRAAIQVRAPVLPVHIPMVAATTAHITMADTAIIGTTLRGTTGLRFIRRSTTARLTLVPITSTTQAGLALSG